MTQAKRVIGLFFIMIIIIVSIWIIQISTENKPFVDQMTRSFAEWLVNSSFYDPFRWITNFGSDFFLIPFVSIVAILLFIWYKDWFVPFVFAGGTLLSHGLNLLIKAIVTRERPSILEAANAEGYSFPSGHAMISLVCYGLLAFFLIQKIKSKMLQYAVVISLSILILLIGISRFVINVHYLTDVLAGFVIGYGVLIGLIAFYTVVQRKKNRQNIVD